MSQENTELTVIIEKSGIEPQKANELLGNLPQIQAEREVLIEQYNEVLKLDINNISTSKRASEVRKLIKDNRTKGILVWHKTTKDYFLSGGRFVDAVKNREEAINERMEETLEQIEKHFEIQEAKRKQELKDKRSLELSEYTENTSMYPLGEMSDSAFEELKQGLKLQKEAKIEAERKVQFEKEENERLDIRLGKRRIEIAPYVQFFTQDSDLRLMPENEYQTLIESLHKAKADYDLEQENIRKENERQKKLLEEKEAQIRKEREESERKAKAEKERQDAILAEQQRQNELKLKAEREAKEKLEKELQDKKDAELKAENERKQAEKKALLAPDKDKLLMLSNTFKSIQLPELKTVEATEIIKNISILQQKLVNYIIEQSEKL